MEPANLLKYNSKLLPSLSHTHCTPRWTNALLRFSFFGDVQRQPVVVLAMTYIVQTTNSRYLSSTSCRAVFSARSSGKTTASVRLIVHMHMLVPVKASKRVRVLDHRSGVPYPTLPCSKAARPNKLLEWRRTNKGVLVHACQKLRLHMHACMHGSASDSEFRPTKAHQNSIGVRSSYEAWWADFPPVCMIENLWTSSLSQLTVDTVLPWLLLHQQEARKEQQLAGCRFMHVVWLSETSWAQW